MGGGGDEGLKKTGQKLSGHKHELPSLLHICNEFMYSELVSSELLSKLLGVHKAHNKQERLILCADVMGMRTMRE